MAQLSHGISDLIGKIFHIMFIMGNHGGMSKTVKIIKLSVANNEDKC